MANASYIDCPNCGSNLHFDMKTQAFPCDSCRSVFSFADLEQILPEEKLGDISDTVAASTVHGQHESFRTVEGDNPYDASHMQRVDCPKCGAHIVTETGTAAAFCKFCGNHVVDVRKLTAQDISPRRILPFKKTREEAQAAYARASKNKPFLPRAFRGKDRAKEFQSIYVPFWLYDARGYGTITAECKNISTWSDSEYDYTKTDIYHAIRVGNMRFAELPFDGSELMDDETMRLLEPFHTQELTDFSTRYMSGYAVASPDTSNEALLARFKHRAASYAVDELRSTITGYDGVSVRSSEIGFGDVEAEYVVFPAWVLTTEYKGKPYIFAMNGQTGKTTGRLPVDGKRVWSLIGIMGGALTLLLFLVQEVMIWIG